MAISKICLHVYRASVPADKIRVVHGICMKPVAPGVGDVADHENTIMTKSRLPRPFSKYSARSCYVGFMVKLVDSFIQNSS